MHTQASSPHGSVSRNRRSGTISLTHWLGISTRYLLLSATPFCYAKTADNDIRLLTELAGSTARASSQRTEQSSATLQLPPSKTRHTKRSILEPRLPSTEPQASSQIEATDPLADTQPAAELHIRRNTRQDTRPLQALADTAYAAYRAGDLIAAKQQYNELLRRAPGNSEARNALALLHWREGQSDQAASLFQASLQADPVNDTALSALALLSGSSDPIWAENRLRNLIAKQPAAATPHFALGSLLARQGRWGEAQQSLFQALTLDTNNPDVMFNLAVCLDHLQKTRQARQFYIQALQASALRPSSFDPAGVQIRLKALDEGVRP
jgi:Flp pilus assembly protein TadD